MSISKSKAQVIHAKKRMEERFGIKLNRKTYGEMVKKIQSGKEAWFISRKSNRVSLFYVLHDGKAFRCVYDSNRKKIVTVLPEP